MPLKKERRRREGEKRSERRREGERRAGRWERRRREVGRGEKKEEKEKEKPRRGELPAAKQIPDEELPPVSEEAERFLWSSLQNRFDTILGAFYFLKGRKDGKHADVISETEFVSGLFRLELTERIKDTEQEEEINEIFQLADVLTRAQKKEILMQSRNYTEEAARKFLLKFAPDDQRILDAPQRTSSQSAVKESFFRNHQAIAMFRAYNESKSGWLTQGEFVNAQSRWSSSHVEDVPRRTDPASSQAEPSFPLRRKDSLKRTSSASPIPSSSSAPRTRTVKPFLRKTDPFASLKPQQQPSRTADNLFMDLHSSSAASREHARKEEIAMLNNKLATIRSLEEKLRMRQKEVELKGSNLELHEASLAKREAALLERERRLEEATDQLRAQHVEVESMKQELAKQMKEVESRALWVKEQKAVFEKREQLLNDQTERLEKMRQEGGGTQGSAAPQTSNMERLEGLYRQKLDQAKLKPGGQSRRESQRGGVKTAGKAQDVLRDISTELHREKDTIGGKLKQVEDLLQSVKNV
uniref:EF-hand domain-containing protein n=1 Tax=Guillardia theta TaxID=55529 RepID=A0A7S4P2N2_GUITH